MKMFEGALTSDENVRRFAYLLQHTVDLQFDQMKMFEGSLTSNENV